MACTSSPRFTPVGFLTLVAALASAGCGASRRQPATATHAPAQSPPATSAPAPQAPAIAGTYGGADRNTLTVTLPVSMPAQVVESAAQLTLSNVTPSSVHLGLVDREEGARCDLTASGGPSRWSITPGQTCVHTRGPNVITLTITSGTLTVEGESAELDFDATAEVAPSPPNAAAPHVAGTARYHLAAHRGAELAAGDAGAPNAAPSPNTSDGGAANAADAATPRHHRHGHGAPH